MSFDESLTYAIVIIVVGAVIACLVVIYAMRKTGRKKKEEIKEQEKLETGFRGLPFKITRSISPEEASKAREELRILELEREILSDAIRRLYEAHAEGKITEGERERLAQTYKARMMSVKEAMTKDEHLVALHELEAMQEDLLKLFSERFEELSGKIEELRSKVEAKPIKEIAVPTTEKAPTVSAEEKPRRKRKQPLAKPSPRTEAEKRIEEIRAEVEKVLERLGQMEIET